jgi:hypothetical protein
VLALVGGYCGLAALVAGIHELAGIHDLYGLYHPAQAAPRVVAPLLSGNHFGCLMAVGAIVALALALYRRQLPWLRAVWLVVVGACSLAMLGTLSRGAAVALGLGAFVAISVLVAQRLVAQETPNRRRAGFLTSSLPIGVVAACTVVAVLYAGAGGVTQQLTDTSLDELHAPRSKFAAWRSAAELVEESPWVGIGRGALEPVFTRVHPASAFATYSHLENEYLEAVVDWGVPGTALLAIAAVWLAVTALRKWRDGPLVAGGLGALAVVVLQSNVDFGVELLGIAAPITAIAATLCSVPVREAPPRAIKLVRAARAALIVALVGCAALLFSRYTTTVEEDHLAVRHVGVTIAELREPLARHPLDFYNYEVAAQISIRERDPRAIQLLNHALGLHPTNPGLHLLAAHVLVDTGHPEQATVEYAAALAPVKENRKLLAEIASRFPTELAAAAIPIDEIRLDQITGALVEMGHSDIAVAWLARVLAHHPQATHACDLLYAEAARTGDVAVVTLASQRCQGYQAGRDTRIALSRMLLGQHAADQAAKLLGDVESWQGRRDEKADAWLLLCDAHLALAHWDDAKRCLRRLDASGLLPPERASEIATRLEQARVGAGSASP